MNKELLIDRINKREHWESIEDIINESLEGMVLVPIEPTEAMLEVARDVPKWTDGYQRPPNDVNRDKYIEMINAAKESGDV